MKYFLHDTSAFDDEKITELFIEFGYEGLGLFYTILEKLAKQEKPIKTAVLKRQLQIGKKLEKCWLFMENIGLISSNNGETFNKTILNVSENYKIKSEKNAKRISEWRERQLVIENVTRYESVCNASNEKKVNTNKVNDINLDFVSSDFLEAFNKWIQYKKEKKQSYKSKSSLEAAYKKLIKLSENKPEHAEQIIDDAMAANYSGFFALKFYKDSQKEKPQSRVEGFNSLLEKYQ